MSSWLRRNYLYVLFALTNSLVAAPAGAALDDDFCIGDDGAYEHCCTGCFIFCSCARQE